MGGALLLKWADLHWALAMTCRQVWGDYNEAPPEAFVGVASGERLCEREGGTLRPRPYKFSFTPHVAGWVEFVEYDAARRVGWGHVVLELYTHERSWPFILLGDHVEQNLEVVWPDRLVAELMAETAATAVLKAMRICRSSASRQPEMRLWA